MLLLYYNTKFAFCHFLILPQSNIKNHHQRESDRKTNRTDVSFFFAGGFWNKLLNYDINHCTCRKRKQIWKERKNKGCEQNGDDCGNRLDNAGKSAVEE